MRPDRSARPKGRTGQSTRVGRRRTNTSATGRQTRNHQRLSPRVAHLTWSPRARPSSAPYLHAGAATARYNFPANCSLLTALAPSGRGPPMRSQLSTLEISWPSSNHGHALRGHSRMSTHFSASVTNSTAAGSMFSCVGPPSSPANPCEPSLSHIEPSPRHASCQQIYIQLYRRSLYICGYRQAAHSKRLPQRTSGDTSRILLHFPAAVAANRDSGWGITPFPPLCSLS